MQTAAKNFRPRALWIGRGPRRAGWRLPRLGSLTVRRYSFALLVAAVAVTLKLALSPLLTRDEPVLFFLGATLLAATVGGLGPGLMVIAIGTLCDEYFFMAPYGTWHLNSPDQVLRLFLFAVEGAIISMICARTRAARTAAEVSAAAAVELQQHVTQIADHERRRLGHDLHDGLGQQLTGIALLTRRLQERLASAGGKESIDAASLATMIRDALGWTHDLCGTLDPAMSHTGGLPQALTELASKSAALLGVDCRFEQAGPAPAVEPEHAVHLYRIAQEAISNAARHGRAQRICVRLENLGDTVHLQVSDDGVGIGPAAGHRPDGMGLRIMRYRAQMLGGSVAVTAAPSGCGTLVRCQSPLNPRAADALPEEG